MSKKKELNNNNKSHWFVNIFLVLLLIISLCYFGINLTNKDIDVFNIINSLIITIFTILFSIIGISYSRKSKSLLLFSGLFLLGYFILNLNNTLNIFKTPVSLVPNFTGNDFTEVVSWAEGNNITINQEYEYSDMIKEYKVISQDVESGKLLKDIKELTVSISEGPNPSKEIIVPSMIGWEDQRVIDYVKDNYLNNVEVEFVKSEKAQYTVIEQNKTGNLKRDDKLKLTFSYGEELGFDEVKLIDFTNMSKFEIEFYMKKNQLRYEFDKEFSKKIKKGYGIKQSIKAGETVKIDDKRIKVTLSRGPKITIPKFKEWDMSKITEWAIKHKLKLEFIDKYDDSVKEGLVIKTNHDKGDTVEQGTVLKITISKGKLKMPKFKSFSDFREWANKYEIKFEEEHKFDDKIPAGEVISYSHKAGDTIKNNDSIVVTISDGKKKEVPNLKGLTKKEAISKLESAGLNYNFVYKASDEIKEGRVIKQSISSGSEVSKGTTITLTISTGKEEVRTSSSSSSSSSSSKPSSNSKPSSSTSKPSSPTPSKPATPTCNPCYIQGLKPVYQENIGSFNGAAAAIRSAIQNQCPGIKVSIIPDEGDSGKTPGSVISGAPNYNTNSCDTIVIKLAK